MINEIVKTAKEIYGNRKTPENYCTFCGYFIGNSYCTCLESFKINHIARRLNERANALDRLRLFNIEYDPTKNNNVPVKYASASLKDYKDRTFNEKQVLKQVQKYQDEIIKNFLTGKNLLLIGNYGTAKSLLQSALCNYCTSEKKLTARYLNVTELTDEVKSTFSDGTEKTTQDVINGFIELDVLFIDDIDKESPKEFVRNLLYKIINKRYELIKPTVISSNADLQELDEKFFGEATISRIKENSEIVYFKAENERLKAIS